MGGTLSVTGNTSLSTLNTSGLATLNSVSVTNNTSIGGNETVGGTLSVTGNTNLSTLATSGLATLNSVSVTNNSSIGGNETVGGTLAVTGNTSLSTLNTSGLATLNSASITNNATVGGTLSVTGNTSLSTLTTSGAASLNSVAIANNATVGGTLNVAGAATLNGPATINNSLSVDSNGTAAGGHTFFINGSGVSMASQSDSGMSYTDHSVKNSITVGDDRYYTNKDGAVSSQTYGTIVTGRMYVDGDLTVNGYLTSTNPNSASGIVVNNSGVSVDGLNNSVGLFADSNIDVSDGRGSLLLQEDTASLTVVNPVNNQAHGLTVGTRETVLNNGTDYTTLTLNDSGATLTADRNATSTDGRGELSLQENSASLTVVNPDTNHTHGIIVGTDQTVISGGTSSTMLTLNDNGATFSDDATGRPVRVTGIADGKHRYDAVNYGQLQKAYSGIAAVSAMSAIPDPVPGKKFSVGLGVGTYMEEEALAVGFKGDIAENIRVTSGIGMSRDRAVLNAGIGFSF